MFHLNQDKATDKETQFHGSTQEKKKKYGTLAAALLAVFILVLLFTARDAAAKASDKSSLVKIEWQKSFGGRGGDEAHSIQQTTDGGFIVAGWSRSTDGDVSGNHGDYDYWVLKLASSGTIQWQKSLGGSGTAGPWRVLIQQTTDGGYIVVGYTTSTDGDVSGNHGGGDCWVVKLSASGEIQWQKALGGSGQDVGASIQQTTDGGYIVAGASSSNDGDVSGNHGSGDCWVVKLSTSGTIQWQKSLGGSGQDIGHSIQQTTDGGYIVAGYSTSTDGDVSGNHGGGDGWVVKLTPSGEIRWQKSLGGSGLLGGHSIQQTTDGGYIVVGYSRWDYYAEVSGNHGGTDYCVAKLSSDATAADLVFPVPFPFPSNVAISDWRHNEGSDGHNLNVFTGYPGGVVPALGHSVSDLFALDINLNTPTQNKDAGLQVRPIGFGEVVWVYGDSGYVVVRHNIPVSTGVAFLDRNLVSADIGGASRFVWHSGYMHMRNINVSQGDRVTNTTILGNISDKGTGNAHLHFAVYDKDMYSFSPWLLMPDWFSTIQYIAGDNFANYPNNETVRGKYRRSDGITEAWDYFGRYYRNYRGEDFSNSSEPIARLRVLPETLGAAKGERQLHFSVSALYGNIWDGANDLVDWSVSGNKSSSTVITAKGFLSIAANESAATLTVTATLKSDPAISANATVTIK
jgi:hypothetical protein